MKSPTSSPSLLDLVRRHLIDVAGLAEIAPSAGLDSAGADARIFRLASRREEPLRLLVDQHHTIEAHGLVLDRRLGSIGLIHFLPAPDPTKTDPEAQAKALESSINGLIENAAYLRHLLALKRSAAPEPMTVLLPAIEIVFLAGDSPRPREALAAHLRRSLQESALLHALSVGVAYIESSEPALVAAQLRRAFCWLLPATDSWLRGLFNDSDSAAKAITPRPWDTLQLENFRRPGTRTWKKSPAPARLHVIHGPNGSGKSTLAEGFEFVVTAGSTRLKPLPSEADGERRAEHFAPLIYRDESPASTRVARATLYAKDEPVHTRSIPATDATGPHVAFPGGALRLDQKLVDQLSQEGSATRAKKWLETYFGDLDRDQIARNTARRNARLALATLLGTSEPEFIERRLKILAEHVQPMAAGKPLLFADLLLALFDTGAPASLDPMQLGELGLQLPTTLAIPVSAFDDPEHGWTPDRREAFRKQADTALKDDTAVLDHWRETDHPALRQILADLGRHAFGESTSSLRARIDEGPDRPATFNRHLRVVALLDLLERARAIAQTAHGVPAGLDEPLLAAIKPALGPTEIAAEIERLKAEREQLHKRLAAWTQIGRAERGEAGPGTLTDAQLDQLLRAVAANTFSPLIIADEVEAFAELIRTRRPGRLQEIEIGSPDWTELLSSILHRREGVMTTFGGNLLQSAGPKRLGERADALVRLVDAAVALARLEKQAETRLEDIASRTGLDLAISELVALLTPARWAYPSLSIRFQPGDETGEKPANLEIHSQGLDVGLMLNTAELNTLSLALHLLCAPRVDNPYRVVFLDDPLQNMDELTVATVARTLARLQRLWSRIPRLAEWDLVLLLHGEENCQRILLDAPAAYYRLPWLPLHGTPSEASIQDDVAPDPGTEKGVLIDLTDFFTEIRSADKSA